MKIFEKSIIEGFDKPISDEVLTNTLTRLSFVLENSINEIKKNNPYVSDSYEILPVNEFYSGGVLPTSKLVVFLNLTSPQLELNSVNLTKNYFKGLWLRLKNAWKNRNVKKRSKKKNKKTKKEEPIQFLSKEKYDINDFSRDLVNAIALNITNKSLVELKGGKIYIKGEDLAFEVQILPVINKSGSYNFYLPHKNKFFNIDFKKRAENIDLILENYGEDYTRLCQIFSAIYKNINNVMPNAIFIESLIANLPQKLFLSGEDIYQKFIFACNYLVNSDWSKFFAITNPELKIYEEKLCGVSLIDISNFMKSLNKFL